MSKQKKTYTESIEELEQIVLSLERDNEISMNEISEKIKRAGVLMSNCKKQLHELNSELERILDDIET